MEFRPCIDIHNGKVKQIVGSSLRDAGDAAEENFTAERGADYYAGLFCGAGLRGGHIILLNGKDSPYYEATRAQAFSALRAYPGGMQLGGGITRENAAEALDTGASHVIVTSYIFQDGRINRERLEALSAEIGAERLVLDVSCRRTEDGYRIATDRWQKLADEVLSPGLLAELGAFCDEFLIHAVDVEGKAEGVERELLAELGAYLEAEEARPITYAGGVHSYADIEQIRELGRGKVHVTVGSALDLYGGALDWRKIAELCR